MLWGDTSRKQTSRLSCNGRATRELPRPTAEIYETAIGPVVRARILRSPPRKRYPSKWRRDEL